MHWFRGNFVYRGRIINSPLIIKQLQQARELSIYAFPVPGGKIVEFDESPYQSDGRPALYRVNVRLK